MPSYCRKTSDIFISDDFRSILDQFKHLSSISSYLIQKRISKDILVENHINYISISQSDPSKISYLTSERMMRIDPSEYWTSPQRFHCKSGTLISKIFSNPCSKEIEKFSNLYKSFTNKKDFTFEVIKGEDIIEAYHQDNYASQRGSLGSSCMKYSKCSNYLSLYTESEIVSMLVIKNPSQKIIGRALLWDFFDEISKTPKKIMDRIYTIHDSEWEPRFKLWAIENGYEYKTKQNWGSSLKFGEDGKVMKIGIKIKKSDFSRFPYLDTFKWLDKKNKILYNFLPRYTNGILELDEKKWIPTERVNDMDISLLISSDGLYESCDYFAFDQIDKSWVTRSEMIYLEDKKIWTSISNCTWNQNLDRYILNKPYELEIIDQESEPNQEINSESNTPDMQVLCEEILEF